MKKHKDFVKSLRDASILNDEKDISVKDRRTLNEEIHAILDAKFTELFGPVDTDE